MKRLIYKTNLPSVLSIPLDRASFKLFVPKSKRAYAPPSLSSANFKDPFVLAQDNIKELLIFVILLESIDKKQYFEVHGRGLHIFDAKIVFNPESGQLAVGSKMFLHLDLCKKTYGEIAKNIGIGAEMDTGLFCDKIEFTIFDKSDHFGQPSDGEYALVGNHIAALMYSAGLSEVYCQKGRSGFFVGCSVPALK